MTKVSVIVPVYNAQQYLETCMDSICGQTLKELEILCVDDGSTDASYEILQNYAKKDSRIKLLSQKNQYAGVARNHGMKYARGKYMAFLDADDYFECDMLEKMYERAEEGNLDLVICRYGQYSEKTGKVMFPDWTYINSFFHTKQEFSGKQLKHAGIFQIANGWPWDKLFRTDFVKACGYEYSDFRSSEDGFFVFMLMARAERISYLDDIFVRHRIDLPGSLSNTRESNWENGFKMLLLIKDEMERLGIYKIYEQSFLNEVVNFTNWYLESLHTFQAYENSYLYIQNTLEKAVGIMNHDREYYFQDGLYDWYREVYATSLAEYLFEKGKRLSQEGEINTLFPYTDMEKDKVLILYGAGKVGKAFYSQLMKTQFCKKVIWMDREYQAFTAMGMDVENPDRISQIQFDYIFIAVMSRKAQEEIARWLLSKGVRTEQIKYYGNSERT
ncbi:MAG: glycosyltransferase family 2 protein [Lachnospiraceae bacterium]|jgi:glycosyltransferase involved in cell wall biosynthesis|nr:glycosyltransferase family 2 protein [Lachnospiraceae bacterium]